MRLLKVSIAAFGLMLMTSGAAFAAACVDTSAPAGVIIADDGAGACGDIQRTGSALKVTGTFTPSGTGDVNIKQVNGATVNVGAGAAGTGTQRVTTSTDSTIGTVTAVTTVGTITNPVGVKGADGSTITSAANALPVASSPGARTLVTLDVKTVTTGATAVTAIAAGHRTAGGFLQNPIGATINLCINEIGTASGTTSSGDLTCILPGQSYTVAPAATGVSVITSDSSHPFSGYGMN